MRNDVETEETGGKFTLLNSHKNKIEWQEEQPSTDTELYKFKPIIRKRSLVKEDNTMYSVTFVSGL